MPNGGSICCAHCALASATSGRCEIFGTEASPSYLCRHFRLEHQTHAQAHAQWKMLGELAPGMVYSIDNSYPASGERPRAVFGIVPLQDTDS